MWSSKALQCHCGKRWQQGGLWVKATVHLKMNMFFQKPFDEIFLWNTKADVCFPYNICQSLKTILSVCFSHTSICDNKIRGNGDLSHHSDLFSTILRLYRFRAILRIAHLNRISKKKKLAELYDLKNNNSENKVNICKIYIYNSRKIHQNYKT